MHIILFLLMIFSFVLPVFTQEKPPTQKEMQAQMLEAINQLNIQIVELEKQLAEAKKNKEEEATIKGLEEQIAMLKKQVALMGGLNKRIPKLPGISDQKGTKNPFISAKRFPERKTALLASLPKRNISQQELTTFLTAIYTELKKKLPVEKVNAAQKIITALKGDPEKLAITGVTAWYQNAPSDALLLLTYAASKSPDDHTLNNCGAIFNLCGLEDKAIPVLKYVLAHQPDNSTVLNNIGQAYAGLGELDTAMHYLMACRTVNPSHPEACATAAYIEAERGNTAEAVKLMSEALKTGYSDARVKFINAINPNNSLPLFTMHDLDLKNSLFFRNDFSFPPNCRQWSNCEDVDAKQQEFNDKIGALIKRYQADIAQNSMVTLTTMSPFNEAVYFKLKQIGDDYVYRIQQAFELMMSQVKTITESSNNERMVSDAKYDAEYRACYGRSDQAQCQDAVTYRQCIERKGMDERYFNAMADVSENYKNKRFPLDLEYTNKVIWLMSLRSTDDRFLKAETAVVALQLLHTVTTYTLSTCSPAGKPNCEQYNPANPNNPSSPAYKNSKCPINIIVPFVVGKINLNCSKFEFEAGQGLVFTYEKDFISKETTIALGPGASVGNRWIAEAGVKAQGYVKFDGNNQPVDAGVSAEVEVEITGPISPVIKAGFTAGVNSGINPTGQLTPFVSTSTYSWK